MNFTSVPIIVVCCYIIGEFYKLIFRNKTKAYKFIPILMSVVGGVLGIVIFYTNPEMIFDAENVWIALGVGIVSGISATGTNQIIKQLFDTNDAAEKEDKDDSDTQETIQS